MSDGAALLQVEFDANIAKLTAALDKAAAASTSFNAKIYRDAQASKARLESLFGQMNLGKGLNQGLSDLRSQLTSTASGIPVFGAAVGSLGPAGLAAAAALGALSLAFERTKKAADWAEDVTRAAKAMGETTTAVQEFDFVANATGIPVSSMRSSLQGLADTIGKVQDNLVRGKQGAQVKVFEAIFGENAADAKKSLDALGGDLDAILPKILDFAAKLAPTQRAGLAQALKMDPQVLNSLVDARDKVSGLIDEAHSLGIVLDADVIKKFADSAEKMHTASAVIDAELTVAFAQLAPMAGGAAEKLAQAAIAVGDIIRGCQDALAPIANLIGMLGRIPGLGGKGGPDWIDGVISAVPLVGPALDAARQVGQFDRAHPKVHGSQTQSMTDSDMDPKVAATPFVADTSGKTKKGPRDDSAEKFDDVQGQVEEAQKALAEALAALTGDIQKHADLEKQANDDELAKSKSKIDAEEQKISADKGISAAKKQQLIAELEIAKSLDQQATDAKNAKIDRDAAAAIEMQNLDHQKTIDDMYSQIAEYNASIASTSEQRRAIELQNLAESQKLAYDIAKADLDAQVADGKITQSYEDEYLGSLSDLQGMQRQKTVQDTQSPGQKYASQLNQTYGGGLDDSLQSAAVSGLQAFGSGLDDIILKTKTAKEAFHEWSLSVVKDLLSMGTKDLIERPLANMMFPGASIGPNGSTQGSAAAMGGLTTATTILTTAFTQLAATMGVQGAAGVAGAAGGAAQGSPGGGLLGVLGSIFHFAGGTDDAPGGLSLIGEDGPELMNVPQGAQITPNSALSALKSQTGSPMRVAAPTYAPTFNFKGAVMTDDLVRQMNAHANRAAQQASMQAVSYSRIAARQDIATRQRQRLGP